MVLGDLQHRVGALLHRLEQHPVPGHMLPNEIEREQWVPKVVEDPHEDDEVELLTKLGHVVDIELREFDVGIAQHLGRQAGLLEIALVAVDA